MTKHEYNTTQHETARVQHEKTRVQHDTTRVQHNINFILIYLNHGCTLGTWNITDVLKFRKLKIAFPVNAKIELESLKATICCNFILIVSFFPFKFSYKKAFE